MMIRAWIFAALLALLPLGAEAANCNSNPFTLTNGQTADATQVMANFNNLLNCSNNNLAHNGANSDLTSISGLTTPLSVPQGGTGAATFPLTNGLLVGNGTNIFTTVAPSTKGNLLASDGTQWKSVLTPAVTSILATGLLSSSPIAGITTTGTLNVPAANAATTLAGTDVLSALTPGGFAGNKTLAANGTYALPGGLIIAWGAGIGTVTGAGSTSVTFPIAFPNNCYQVIMIPNVAVSGGAAGAPGITAFGSTSFTVQNSTGTSFTAQFIAIGN
jgi:hypothetical protein